MVDISRTKIYYNVFFKNFFNKSLVQNRVEKHGF